MCERNYVGQVRNIMLLNVGQVRVITRSNEKLQSESSVKSPMATRVQMVSHFITALTVLLRMPSGSVKIFTSYVMFWQ